jgi:hypothetical protein
MQKHEGPSGDPDNANRPNRPQRSTTWWLMLIIFGLVGLIVGQLILRWL